MKYKIIYTKSYNKIATKFLRRHPELEKQYEKTLKLLEINPNHPSLRLHKLSGKLKSLFSVSVNIRYRKLVHFIINEYTIVPISIGSHDDMYR